MQRTYSLAQLTALPWSPPRLLQLAAELGCAGAGLRLLPAAPGGAHYPLMDDAALLRDTLAVQAATGMQVFDLEIVRLAAGFDAATVRPFLEVGARLGAKHVLVAGDDADAARLTASFAALCEAARPFGLSCDLEFMPWTKVPNAASARGIVEGAAQPNGGVLVDALHFARSATTLEDIAALPRHRLHYAQICDGAVPGPDSVEGLIHDARCERMLPGEGGIPLHALFERLPADLTVSVEVPSDTRAPAMGYAAWAKLAVEGARRVLEGGR